MIKYLSEGAYDYLDSESWEYGPDFGVVENMYHKFPEMDFYNEVNLNDDKIAFFFDGYGDTEKIKDFLDGAGLEYRIGKKKNYKNKINLIVYVQMPDGYTEDEERIDDLISAMEKFGYWYNATDSDDDMPVFRHNGQSVTFHGGWDEVEEWIDELEQDALYDEDLYESRKRMKESYENDAIAILNKIRAEDDGIARFTTLHDMTYSYCLVPYCQPEDVGTECRRDIMGCIEYTLHELIDSGMENKLWVLGAFERNYDDEDENELEDFGELIDIDLGYFIFVPSAFEVIECGSAML